MAYMTAEEALDAAKGMTFEKMWALMMEDRERQAKLEKEMKAHSEETERFMRAREAQAWIARSTGLDPELTGVLIRRDLGCQYGGIRGADPGGSGMPIRGDQGC
jgi:hypothetical protein